MTTNQELHIPLYGFTDLGRRQVMVWKSAGLVAIVLVTLLYQQPSDLLLLFAGGLLLLKPLWMLVSTHYGLKVRHVFWLDDEGAVHLERQRCFRGQVLHRQTLDPGRYDRLRIFEPGDGTVALQLGNAQDQTHVIAQIRPGVHAPSDGSDVQKAREELTAVASRISRLTGIENRSSHQKR